MNRWEINGRTITRWRCAAGFTVDELSVRTEIPMRVIVGVEKGYWRFKTEYDADKFVAKIQKACKDKLESERVSAALMKKEAV